jgi:hypothetical protein
LTRVDGSSRCGTALASARKIRIADRGFVNAKALHGDRRRLPLRPARLPVAEAPAAFGAARVLWPQTPGEDAAFDTLESALADYGAK